MARFPFRVAPWQRLRTERVLDNRWLNVRRETCALPDGRVVDDYYVVAEPDVACVVALTPEGNVLLCEQYKHGIGRACLEIPGGAFDLADADPLAVAQRELLEETGCASDDWQPLGVVVTSPTRTTVQVHLFLARACVQVADQSLDPNEDILIHRVPWAEALTLVRAGVINAATSVSGLLLAESRLGGAKAPR